jgi:acyl-CoA thioesterase I
MKRFLWPSLFFIFFSYTVQSEKNEPNQKELFLFIGDSLTEGYGVARESAYPQVFQNLVQSQLKRDIRVMNGSVSGSTTSSGPSRLRWFLRQKPDVLVIALGANDGLRGLSVSESQKHLEEMITMAQEHEIQVVMAGMLMPANYGEDYRKEFEKMYTTLVKKYQLLFIPFLLEGVATVRELNQADGIHPNEQGHQIIGQTVFQALKEIF